MLRRLAAWLRPPPAPGDGADLASFVAAEASFLAQKTVVEYCRARTGLNWRALFEDAGFQALLTASRWRAFAAVLPDMIVVTEGYLRPHAGAAAAVLAQRLAAMVDEILARVAAEASAEVRAAWPALRAQVTDRLAQARLAPPAGPAEVARTGAAAVFESLPIHPSLRAPDRELIDNAIRFGMVAYWQKLRRTVPDPAGLAGRLVSEAGG